MLLLCHVKWTSTLIRMCENNHGFLVPSPHYYLNAVLYYFLMVCSILYWIGIWERRKHNLPSFHTHWAITNIQIILLLGSRERERERDVGSELCLLFWSFKVCKFWTSFFLLPIMFFFGHFKFASYDIILQPTMFFWSFKVCKLGHHFTTHYVFLVI
jgi:hypothetical protein